MTSANDLWLHVDNARWFWSVPAGIMATTGLYYMSQLSAPQTVSGILGRVLFMVGFTLMLGSAVYDVCGWGRNGLGRFGVLFVMAGSVTLIRQVALSCIRQRKNTKEPHATFGRRVLASLIEGH